MPNSTVLVGKKYRITYPDRYHAMRHEGKVATAKELLYGGDVRLELRNGELVIYHSTWLEPVGDLP